MGKSRARVAIAAVAVVFALLRVQALEWVLPVLGCLLGALGIYEFQRMGRMQRVPRADGFGIASTILLISTGLMPAHEFEQWLIPALLFVLMGSFVVHMIKHAHVGAYRAIPLNFFGPVYVGLPLALAVQILQADRLFFIFSLLCVWVCDTGAYYAGRNLGKIPLAPKLSPKKTVEGAVGGLLACVAAAAAFKALAPEGAFAYAWWKILTLAGLFGVLAPIGDLGESVLKRDSGVKDSGRAMRGHGGVLDRIDSVLFCFSAAYVFLELDGKL